ncbi:MAG: isoleucine--tRNA ligase [Verrucomicrobia bacterium]|nr:isoleucine--tRNA ligase [Verrucomicrobiota bacterium]
MDYKDTLNLPKTSFPMKANLVHREPQRLEKWNSTALYKRIQERRREAPKYILHDGPPFANGDVHIGTALNKILKDFIIKHQNLIGNNAPYLPGWDCHGLPIEFKVIQQLRKEGVNDADPVRIRAACEEYAKKFIGLQRTQFKRLGVIGDWDDPYLTFNKQYEAAELRLFADIVEKGFVYRGKKPVYWSIPCKTALAEAEVEYKDHLSKSIYVKFPVIGQPNTFILIWTTTPWTLPANLAIAFNSSFDYTIVHAGEESYIMSVALMSQIVEKCGLLNFQIMRSVHGSQMEGLKCRHPFIDREIPLLAGDDFVDNTTGTGFVHTAPGHGLDDFYLGQRNQLPAYSPVDDEGRFCYTDELPIENQMPESLIGKSILEKQGSSQANESVLEILRDSKMLLHEEDYSHSYPHCWRSKTPIIFRAMHQWFINVDHDDFREKALETVKSVKWIPEWGQTRIEAAIKSRPDWCISRQRAWGVPIPAFYDKNHKTILDARIVRNTADLIEKHGSNVWFERSAEALWTEVKPAVWDGPEAVDKSTDTLDVWIDSGSSSRSVLMQRPELQRTNGDASGQSTGAMPAEQWQADLYLEGSDQHRGWFQSSLLLSLAGNGVPPFKTVLTHGFMVDADREKISKSKQGQGGYVKPQTSEAYVGKWGADLLRLWVSSQDFRNDIVVSEDRIKKVSEIYRVIRNALRYELSNLFDFDPSVHSVEPDQMSGLDRWILEAFSEIEGVVAGAYDNSEFHVVYQKLSQFIAVELSAIYHDAVKDKLYTDPPNSERRRSIQSTIYRILTGLCRMLSPILAFTADEAWELIPGHTEGDSVHVSDWRPLGFSRSNEEKQVWANLFKLREPVLAELEKARQAKVIGKALEACVMVDAPAEMLPESDDDKEAFRELINVSKLILNPSGQGEEKVSVKVAHAEGDKCGRCWHWSPDVGAEPEHPTICGRCVQAVNTIVNA